MLASLATPVIVDGVNVAPAASVLLGSVVAAGGPSREGGGSGIDLRFDRLRVGATTYDIRTAPVHLPAERTTLASASNCSRPSPSRSIASADWGTVRGLPQWHALSRIAETAIVHAMLTRMATLATALVLLGASAGLVNARQSPAPALAIVGGTVIDGNGGAPVTDTTVIVSGGRIAAVGSARIDTDPARRHRDRRQGQVPHARADRHQRSPVALRRRRRSLRDAREVSPTAARDRARSGAAPAQARRDDGARQLRRAAAARRGARRHRGRQGRSAPASSPPATSSAGAVPTR